MSSGGNNNIQWNGAIEFRGTNHEIEVDIENDELLVIKIENCDTFDQWEGKYDVSYIEELSHKTGNYKQFSVFCSMLESALLQNSEAVTLDLLTYEDLKVLREQKIGKQKRRHKQTLELQNKRYLIMTYSVEFDQIHYPLPLTYIGKTDPVSLKNQICDLKLEIQGLKKRLSRHGNSHEIEVEYKKLLLENQELKDHIAISQQKLHEISTGNACKELKVLKKVVQNLEADLLKERSKHQRILAKKKKEYDELLQEFEELKANERNFRVRCKSLTEELGTLKRNSRLSPMVNARKHNSSNSKQKKTYDIPRSRERSYSNSSQRGRSTSRSISRNRDRSASASSIGRTPSPGFRRFNPSAYIKEKERKKHEVEASRSRRRTPISTSKRNRTPTFGHPSKPPSGNRGQQNSINRRTNISFESDDDSINRLKPRTNSGKRKPQVRTRVRSAKSDTSDDEFYRRNIPKSRVTPSRKSKSPSKTYQHEEDDESESHSIGIAEIDARLEALQRFMKDNMD